jgi:uncharacterized damage-inducible protein DinB
VTYPPLDITAQWGRLNDDIVRLVDYIPDDKLNWSPKPELWNFKGTLIHMCIGRHNWLERDVKDGEPTPDVLRTSRTREAIQQHLRTSWERVARFLSRPDQLAATYKAEHEDGQHYSHTGHWIAYHLLEHDIHHRADIFHYLALLGIEHPEVGTP